MTRCWPSPKLKPFKRSVRNARQAELAQFNARELGTGGALVPVVEDPDDREARFAEARRREREEREAAEVEAQTHGLSEAQKRQAAWDTERARIEGEQRKIRLAATAKGDEPPRFPGPRPDAT